MKYLAVLLLLLAFPAMADEASDLCATNPAFSPEVMLRVIQAQLERDHDPSLDAEPPEKLAEEATAQGISECADEVRRDPSIAAALSKLKGPDLQVGWDAYNTACATHVASRGDCIEAETSASRVIKHMMAKDEPAGAKALAQACQLVMVGDLPMAEWRQCVDEALAEKASRGAAERCKLNANWHVAKTGAEAGQILAACLRTEK